MSDVTLSYKGSDILELSDSGSATLKTGGTYCEADIELAYTKPSGGGGLTLLASGTYTHASDGSSIEIPFQTSGTPLISYVAVDEVISGVGQTAGNVSVNISQITMESSAILTAASTNYNIATNGSGNYAVPIGMTNATNGLYADKIVLRQSASSYQLKANDYKWYVWGIA